MVVYFLCLFFPFLPNPLFVTSRTHPLSIEVLCAWYLFLCNHCIAGSPLSTIVSLAMPLSTIVSLAMPLSTIVSLEYQYRPLYRWNTTIDHCLAGIPLSTIVSLEYHYQPLYRWNTTINHCIAGIPLSTFVPLEYQYQPLYRWNAVINTVLYYIHEIPT